jgi:hypothetical protein
MPGIFVIVWYNEDNLIRESTVLWQRTLFVYDILNTLWNGMENYKDK